MKYIVLVGVSLGLVACAGGVKPTQQEYFNTACGFANGAISMAEPLIPGLTAKLGETEKLALSAGLISIKSICGTPLDLTSAAAITQRVYDLAGEVILLVVNNSGK